MLLELARGQEPTLTMQDIHKPYNWTTSSQTCHCVNGPQSAAKERVPHLVITVGNHAYSITMPRLTAAERRKAMLEAASVEFAHVGILAAVKG